MTSRAVLVLGAAFALAGCYEIPGAEPAEVIAVSVVPELAPADGVTIVDVELSLDAGAAAGSAITIKASTGVVSFGATGDAAQTITLKLPRSQDEDGDGRKTARIPLRVSRTAGVTLISASVGEVTATANLILQPSLPAAMFSETAVSSLTADGAARADIQVFLLAAAPASVSFGTQIATRVCCVDGASGRPAACSSPPPLRVTPLAELTAGNRVTVTAVTERMTGTAALDLWVVSAIPSAPFAEAPCAAPDGVTSSAALLTLRPGP